MTADIATATHGWLTGDHYDDTAELSVNDVADRLVKDIADVQGDGMLPADARFAVTVDTDSVTGLPVLRVAASGIDDADPLLTAHVGSMVFQLAGHYNRVDLDQPSQVRFLQHIRVGAGGDARTALVGAMVQV